MMDPLSEVAVPKQQKQKPVDDEMPEDPVERKRVLNVLAQRRYRRRKKEQQAQLESFIKALGPASDSHESSSTASSQVGSFSTSPYRAIMQSPPNGMNHDATDAPQDVDPSSLDLEFSRFVNCPPDSSIHTTTSPTDSSSDDNGVCLLEEFNPAPEPDLAMQFCSFLQNDEIQTSNFADDYLVSVPELDLLRASHTIALRLHSADRLWDPAATSVFQAQTSFDWRLLPENLRPTSAQLTLPHHPVLDLLPWPKVRTKLITMYNMPSEMWPRHPSDKAEMSPFRLVCDMEDGGIRIFGDDPTSEFAWEVQQMFVNAWWWALDQNVICLSNQKRKARGEDVLRIGALGS